MSEKKPTITQDMPIADIVKKYPDTIEVLLNSGMHCIGCSAARFESIAQGAEAHGLDVDKLMKDLNKAVEKKAK